VLNFGKKDKYNQDKYNLPQIEWIYKDYLRELELYKRTMDGLIFTLDFLRDSACINVGELKKQLKDILDYSKEGYKMVNSCTDYRRGYEDAKKRYLERINKAIAEIDADYSKSNLDGVEKPCKECLEKYVAGIKRVLHEIEIG